MSLLAQDASNIPLHCNICPKRPDFSDVSHLLTHIASKGHLSWYFRTKVKGSTDASAQKVIDDYDEWYEEWDVATLMQERMSQKEKKRASGARRNDTSRRGSGASTASNSARNTPVPSGHGQRQRLLRHNLHMLDPQLNRHQMAEPMSRSVTPHSHFSFDRGMNHPFAPPIGNFAPSGMNISFSGSGSNSPYVKQESMSSFSDNDDDDDDSFVLNTRRRRPATRRRQHNPSESLGSLLDDDASIDDMPNDETKLKGIKWPGMDIFDSATAEMRRKRNQKKHASVLRSLQATSEVVEPTESVWDTEGILRKERLITGSPASDDSLIEGESEPEPEVTEKKRPRRRARPALVDKDVNTGRILRNRGRSHHPPFGRSTRVSAVMKIEKDDDDLTFAPARQRKRAGFSIHRDNSGPDITFENPPPMNYLTSGFRNPFQQNNPRDNLYRQYQNDMNVPRAHGRQPSWGNVNGSFRPTSGGNNAVPTPGLTNFGNFLNHQTVGHPTSAATNHHTPNPFQQHFSFGPQSLQTGIANPMYQPQNNDPFAGLFDINPLAMDLTFPKIEGGLHAQQDMAPANPLFLSSNPVKEDDEVTVSAHDSVNGEEK